MRPIRTLFCLLCCLALFACSSTEQASNKRFSDNGYAQGYVSEHYSKTHFTPVNENTVKKGLDSDHHLMLSLLNRPMTEDQAMMLNFAKQRASYSNVYVNQGITIKGPKNLNSNNRTKHLYAHLIENDINAVTITAPPQ